MTMSTEGMKSSRGTPPLRDKESKGQWLSNESLRSEAWWLVPEGMCFGSSGFGSSQGCGPQVSARVEDARDARRHEGSSELSCFGVSLGNQQGRNVVVVFKYFVRVHQDQGCSDPESRDADWEVSVSTMPFVMPQERC